MQINTLPGMSSPATGLTRSTATTPVTTPPDAFTKSTVGSAGLLPRPTAANGLAPTARHDAPVTLEQILNGVPETLQTRQFADSYGRVTHMAMMMSPYVTDDARTQLLGAYKTLFTEMEPDTKFTVVVQTPDDQADVQKVIDDNHVPNPDRITFLNPNVGDLTVWARDMMVGMYTPDDPSHTALLHQTTMHSWHANDMQVPPKLTAADPSILLDTEPDIVTDGGDVQSNTKEAFVGYYSVVMTEMQIADQMQKDSTLKPRLFDYYQGKTGKQVVEPDNGALHFPYKKTYLDPSGSSPVFQLDHDPDFHPVDPGPGKVTEQQMLEDLAVQLFSDRFDKPVQVMGKDDPTTPRIEEPATDHMDMGCTPIDDQTFLVGDPTLVSKIVGSMTPTEHAQANEAISRLLGRPATIDDMIAKTPKHGSIGPRNRNNPDDFDAYEKTLKAGGYNVFRVPHAEPAQDGDPYISYNNCLMERFDKDGKEVRRVFLPQYGIPKLDDYANNVWKSQGFEVHPIPLPALSAEWGALRCTTNWLDRTPRG